MNPDRDIIKMKYNYEFVEMLEHYMLVLNEEPKSNYPKRKYSRQAAEDEANYEVARAIKRYGRMNVSYDGVFLTPKLTKVS